MFCEKQKFSIRLQKIITWHTLQFQVFTVEISVESESQRKPSKNIETDSQHKPESIPQLPISHISYASFEAAQKLEILITYLVSV